VHSRNCLGLESHLIGKVAATLSVRNMVVSNNVSKTAMPTTTAATLFTCL